MELSAKILSDVIHFMKYSRFIPELYRRENWIETSTRNMDMHIKKYPHLADEIRQVYLDFVFTKKVLPSMRGMQFGGKAIERNPARGYNCSFLPMDSWEAFHEIMFLLLCGSGVGYSVQRADIEKLSEIRKPTKRTRRHLVLDSIEGWSDAIKVLIKSYFFGTSTIEFDYSDIRAKGTPLKTSGGKAPGPQPLKDCIHNLQKILDQKNHGEKLTSLEVHDMVCFISDAVLSGGIRRSSLIALFNIDDEDMLTCKFGDWWELNPQRARANNTAMVLRHKITKDKFFELWNKIEKSGSGEPAIYFSNSMTWGVNPCQPAWATVLTPDGIRTIGDISAGDVIWSGKQWTKVTKKWSTGIKPVYEYRTTGGAFYGTENHRIVSGGEKIQVGLADSIDICPGGLAVSGQLDPQDIMDGLVLGDGTCHKASNNLVLLLIGEDDGGYFSDKGIDSLLIKQRPGVGPYAWEVNTTISSDELPHTYDRKIPTRFREGSRTKICGFLRGLYSANGSLCGDRVTLKATSFSVIETVQEMLSAIGIRSYYTTNKPSEIDHHNGTYTSKISYDLNITVDRNKFAESIGFIQHHKAWKLHEILMSTSKSGKPGKTTYDIVEQRTVSTEEVFDLTVEANEHTYWTGGLLVSNCNEAALRPFQYCNLTTTNTSDVTSQEDFNNRVRAASFIGTLQAGYTDFHYLREIWRETTEKDSLLGVSMTGIASGNILKYNLTEAAEIVKEENARIAKIIGINKAARCTLTKPEGTASLLLGTSSGVHAWHSPYYIRRVTVMKNEPIYDYIKSKLPELVEDDFFKPQAQAKILIPMKAPDGAIFRTESALDLLERVKKIYDEWIKPGHRKGDNTHNVSCTVTIKPDEWEVVGEWMWKNKKHYNGLSVLPEDLGSYVQAPFTECTKEEYEALIPHLKEIHLEDILEYDDNTDLKDQAACAGGVCEIK